MLLLTLMIVLLTGIPGPVVKLDCGSDKGVCSGVYLSYRCDVAGDLLVWKLKPETLAITFSQFDRIGANVTFFDIHAVVLNVTRNPPHLSSGIQFFASEKYNNTKFYCADGVTGVTSSVFCIPRLISKLLTLYNCMWSTSNVKKNTYFLD